METVLSNLIAFETGSTFKGSKFFRVEARRTGYSELIIFPIELHSDSTLFGA